MKAGLIVVAIIAVVAGIGWYAAQPRGSDEEQIIAQVGVMQEAVREKNFRKLMGTISKDYQGVGGKKDELRIQVIGLFRDSGELSAATDALEVTVTGDTARVSTTIHATMESKGGSRQEFTFPAEATFQREQGRKFLVYTVPVWKLTSANARMAVEGFF